MTPSSPTRCPSRWAQVLALVLVTTVGLQGVPLHTLVESVQHAAHHEDTHHQCNHPKGFCPMNPDGPCSCSHDTDPSPTDGPVLKNCHGGGDQPALRAATLETWVFGTDQWVPAPRPHVLSLVSQLPVLTSQRAGGEVFRPPRTEADDRPGSTLQALGSA